MNTRRKRGATLAFIVTTIVVVIAVGGALFLWARMIGGGKEAQQATDSGNLNVAKQALLSPTVPITDPQELQQFNGLLQPGNTMNLQNFNKLVGLDLLAGLNAADEIAQATALGQSTTAATNLAKIHSWVEGSTPDSVGKKLADALSTPSKTQGFFESIAMSNSTRMLGNGIAGNTAEFSTAYMRQASNLTKLGKSPAPSNVSLVAAQIPSTQLPTYKSFTVNKNGKDYIVGYTNMSPVAGLNIMAVPVRPGEQPHLVSQSDFANEQASPLPSGTNSLIPPNAFMSGSLTKEVDSSANVAMRSSAIVGTLNVDFPAALPHGYIIIDNKGSDVAGTSNAANDVFSQRLMEPEHVNVAGGFIASNKAPALNGDSVFNTIKSATPDASGNIPMSAANGIDNAISQSQLNQLHSDLKNGTLSPSTCDTSNSTTGSPSPDPQCIAAVPTMMSTYGSSGGSTAGSVNGLMSIEALKDNIIAVRASPDGAGCGHADATATPCTGLKKYDKRAKTSSTAPLYLISSTSGTLNDLLTQTTVGAAAVNPVIKTQMQQRMAEMAPTATDFESVFSRTIPFDTVQFLFWNGAAFDVQPSLPGAWGLPVYGTADGPHINSQDNIGANDLLVDVDGDGGYPHPWDCESSATSNDADKADWQPSTGYLNLLGIIKFQNCAGGGGDWCCPC